MSLREMLSDYWYAFQQDVVKHATLTPRNYAISIGYSADRRPTTAPNNSPTHGPIGNIECHHVPLTLNFVVSGMIMVAEPIGPAR